MLGDNDWGFALYQQGRWFVARDEGTIIGAIHVTEVDGTRYFDDVLVTEARRGAGIGSEFMRFLLDDRDSYLCCHDNRIAFYRRLGFAEAQEDDLPTPVKAHAYRSEDLPSRPDHVHHLMRRPDRE